MIHFFDHHPWDWICHFILSFLPVRYKVATWWVVLTVGIGLEYEQKTQIHYNHLSWREYIVQEASGDLIADMTGVSFAYWLNKKEFDKQKLTGVRK